MSQKLNSTKPIEGGNRSLRRRLDWKGELALALLPTATILLVLSFVEAFSQQRVLFASLASSAFLIYLDPEHGTNRVRTQVTEAQLAKIPYMLVVGDRDINAGNVSVRHREKGDLGPRPVEQFLTDLKTEIETFALSPA